MKRNITLSIALVSLLALGGPAFAELCTIDDVPAATLLLPYFEVDIGDEDEDGVLDCGDADSPGVTTLFSINNASAAAQLVHMVLWTDWTVPTLDVDIYLTGYDVQTINLCNVFNGRLPVTADLARDPTDTISPSPTGAWEDTFNQCAKFPFDTVELNSTQLSHLRNGHTGGPSSIFGGNCLGADYEDDIARGYVTVDVVNRCSLAFPGDDGYFTQGGEGIASNNNVLWGNYHYIDADGNFAQGETLVHIEADAALTEATVNDTFYSRINEAGETLGQDNREPLGTTYAARYITAEDLFSGGTDFVVWREGGQFDADGVTCGTSPSWFPLFQRQVVCFDEEENPIEICIAGEDAVSPGTGEDQSCFPLETQRVPVGGTNPVPGGDDVSPVDEIGGWCFLNLNHAEVDPTDPKQAHVTTLMSALGRFSTGMDAIQLDSACTAVQPGEFIDLP